jgi:endonuclease/exonuclease/phosphatase family metal-dependent hydrolase
MKLKFITLNVWFGGKIWDNMTKFISEEKPDILAIQEVYDGHDQCLEKRFRTMEEFSKEFGDFLPHSAFGATVLDTGVNVPWGNAVFSKFPILASNTVLFDLPFTKYDFRVDSDPRLAAEGMLETKLDANGRELFVYSWHGVWNNHGGDSKERLIMKDVIIKTLSGKESVIIAGDANIRPDTTVMKEIEEKLNLNNVFGMRLPSTFNMSHKDNPEFASESVDKILVTKNLRVVSSEMPEVDVSDHFPLKAIVEL